MAVLYITIDYLFYILEYQLILKQLIDVNFIVKMKKNYKKQENQNFAKVLFYIIIHLIIQKKNIYSKLSIQFLVIYYIQKTMKIL